MNTVRRLPGNLPAGSLRPLKLCAALALLLAALAPSVASAHPLGNFTVNHYARIEPAGDRVRVVYVLDMAEIPTFQEKPRVNADPAGYAARRAEEVGRNLQLTLNGTATPLRLEQQALSFPPGAGGLETLRLDATFSAEFKGGAASAPVEVMFRDDNEPARIGWREIVARSGAAGTEIQQTSVPAQDTTDELRQYPQDLLNSPLNVREAHLSFVPGAAAARPALASTGVGVLDRTRSAFADLANGAELTPAFVLFAIGVAMVLGMAHALQPGHGKTIVAAYLVGSRGTAKHAFFLGGTVTATHTAGVYALGVVTLFLSQYIVPERLYPILEVVSGLLVVGIGIWLFGSRLLSALGLRQPRDHDRAHAEGHSHPHTEGHSHPHTESHSHGPTEAHSHANAEAHSHAQAEGHGHSPAAATVLQVRRPSTLVGADSGRERAQRADQLTHSHGGSTHTHAPPERISWKSLLALGVSGGLLPCPEALMVLLITIAAHRVLFGLLLIVSFSTGLAAVLVGFGLLLVYARGLFSRVNLSSGFIPRVLPVASALVIVIAGGVITAQALPQVL